MKRQIVSDNLNSITRLSGRWLLMACAALGLSAASDAAQMDTLDEIKQAIVRDSIAAYPRDCPCPYSLRNGSECRLKSAYSRTGGRAVRCFPSDVNDEMVNAYRKDKGQPRS